MVCSLPGGGEIGEGDHTGSGKDESTSPELIQTGCVSMDSPPGYPWIGVGDQVEAFTKGIIPPYLKGGIVTILYIISSEYVDVESHNACLILIFVCLSSHRLVYHSH